MNERQALGWLAVGALVALTWLVLPFVTGLLLGVLMAFTLQPIYAYLVRRTGRPFVASLTTVMASAVVIVGALAGFVSLFVTRAVGLANTVREELRPGGALTVWVDVVTGWLERFGISAASLTARLEAGAGEVASRSAGIAGSLASGTFIALLGLFFALLAMHVVLRYWPRMVSALVVVSPLRPEYTRMLLDEFRRVGHMTLSGTVLTGLAQGVLATIGFWMTGVPQAIFFGVATALASLVPAVGTLLVWIPAGLYLFASGHPAKAIVELVWGALIVVGFSDYVIRPRLVGDAAMPALLTFVALFGGLEVLGLSGLIVGPVIMGLAVAVLRLYAREEGARRATTP
ncbi:MAG TPA: AI-2E family transporter [Methylomirabilota bacterium]|nr:AI-2E family transporter [Methylomirabilota bacterium]